MTRVAPHIQGILLDIDGTLVLHGQPLPGAIETLNTLRLAGYALRFITNATGQRREQIAARLAGLGFTIHADEIQTSVDAGLHYLTTQRAGQSGFLAIPDAIKPLFADLPQTTTQPDYVLLGDLDAQFDYAILNQIFNYLRAGSQLITFHRNPFYFRGGQAWLDSGAFTLALEQITGQQAIVTGKPSAALFLSGLASMGLQPDQVIMVGDDATSDYLGASALGIRAYLVGSGKFQTAHLDQYQVSRDRLLPQISDLLHLLPH